MKKTRPVFVSLLSLLFLTSCGTTSTVKPDSTLTSSKDVTSSEPASSTVPEKETVVVEVTKKFALTLSPEKGSTITLENIPENEKIEAGSKVTFSVKVNDETKYLSSVLLDGSELSSTSFIMPNHDVTLKTVLGSKTGDNTKTSKVSQDQVPTSVQGMVDALKNADAVESKYLSSAHFVASKNGGYETSVIFSGMKDAEDITLEVGSDDLLTYEGSYATSSNKADGYIKVERGIQNDHYYEYTKEADIYDTSTPESVSKLTSYQAISDKEELSKDEISSADAKKNVTSLGIGSKIVNKNFSSGYSGILSVADKGTLKSSLSEDKTSYTSIFTSYKYSSWEKALEWYTFSLTIDGDGFLLASSYSDNKYEEGNYDHDESKDTYTLHKDAVSKQGYGYTYTALRGLRNPLTAGFSIEDSVLSDYDVNVTQETDGYTASENTGRVAHDKVRASSLLSFTYTPKTPKEALIAPRVREIKEGKDIASVVDNQVRVDKVGTFSVIFDNGLGVEKEVSFTSIQPDARKVSLKIDGNDFTSTYDGQKVEVNKTYNLKASIIPETALQDAKITLEDETSATLIKKDDGSYDFTPLKAGKYKLTVASESAAKVTSDFSFNASEKVELDKVKTSLTTHTMVDSKSESFYEFDYDTYDYTYYRGSVNFADDGTASFRIDKSTDQGSTYTNGTVATFKYTLSDATGSVVMTLSDNTTDSNGVKISSVQVIGNTSIKITFSGSCSKTITFVESERVTLA